MIDFDRKNVIKGLYQHCEGSMFDRCGECPYYEIADEPFQCRDALLMDVLALLRENEAVKPNYDINGTTCGNCGDLICRFDTYCSTCGKKVKWNA